MIVLKFGGTSVGSVEAIRRVCDIIKSKQEEQPIIVTSAVGGATNKLVALAKYAGQGERGQASSLLDSICQTHRRIINELKIGEDAACASAFEQGCESLKDAVNNVYAVGALTNELYDAIVSVGEFFTANILPAVLRSQGMASQMLDARRLLVTNDSFGAALPLFEKSKTRVEEILIPLVKAGETPVLQGFIGAAEDGRTTTLGRGGSDYSATLFGAMLGVQTVEIWSDVDGVLTADPSLVKEARRIRYMSFQEAAELAYFGAKVLHPATLAPAVRYEFDVIVRNSLNPEFPGTTISAHRPEPAGFAGRVKSIAYKEGLTVITVHSSRMLMAYGFMARLFSIFDKYETAIDLISTSEVTVSLTVDDTKNLHIIIPKLEQVATVKVEQQKAIVCLVGEGLKRTKGIPGHIFGLLQDTHIYSISLGASEINLSFVIEEDDLPKVVTRLHQYFFNGDLDPNIFAV